MVFELAREHEPTMNSSRTLVLASVLLIGPLTARGLAQQNGPVAPAEAAGKMTLPEGFTATLFASEPDVRQPIAFTLDHRGRLWVAENFTYPAWLQKPTEPDRIIILEDTDGDGHFDRRKVFWEKLGANVSGLAVGFGGVWVCATPSVLFIPDRDGDDAPDGAASIVLDGWDLDHRSGHTLINALTWGPDGWLWGCNGIQNNSRVGRPGTPDGDRVAINCGVWRYHPTRGVFEAVAHGTTNPWGLDFDDYGEAFITNCVIAHLWHVVPGARLQRMYGQDFHAQSYRLMDGCADHLHWAGGSWQDSREGKGKHGDAGGGHAHTGAMVYLGDNWPDRYRNSIFMCNLHGHRVNRDTLTRAGSGYVAHHAPDFLLANDTWFRGMELKYGPDGAVFVTDWTDTGECHDTDGDHAHRENGRIYKIAYGSPQPARVDLAALGDQELVRLQLHKNEWYVRTARRLLQERAAAGQPMGAVHRALREILDGPGDVTRTLRALWALHGTGGLDGAALVGLLGHESEHVRGWAVRLLGDEQAPPRAALAKFAAMAKDDPSPRVRLSLASALQRLPVADRWAIAEGLVAHAEDGRDASLPLMIWYGIEPLVPADLSRALALTAGCKVPLIRQYLARRAIAADTETGLAALMRVLEQLPDADARRDVLAGMLESLRGRKGTRMPGGWSTLFGRLSKDLDPGVREETFRLALLFGDPQAVTALRATLMDPAAAADERRRVLQALVEARTPGLAPELRTLLDDPAMRGPALRGLAAYGDDATPRAILDRYARLSEPDRDDALATLAARPAFALALLDAVAQGVIARRDLSTPLARQLQAFNDPRINDRLDKVWGSVRPTSADKLAQMDRYKSLLTPEALKAADPSRGRLVFQRTCSQCHRLYDTGGDVGPDLTGSDRANLDYLLGNILDPSATVAKEFTVTTVATTDGRVISGILREQTEKTLVLQTPNEKVIVAREDVEAIKPSNTSMMPEGLLDKLTPEEVRDLVAYLATKAQVPLRAEPTGK